MTVITIPGASYFTPNEEPALVAGLVVEALRTSAPRPSGTAEGSPRGVTS